MSVDVEHILNALGLDWRFSLGSYPGHSLVTIPGRGSAIAWPSCGSAADRR